MSAAEHEGKDIDERIEQLHDQAGNHLEACLFRAAYRVYGELKRIAKSEQRVVTYINSVFHQMDLAQSLLDPRTTRDNAIALIPLLEDEERARQFQPDFPAPQYEHQCAWMTACVYENLAEATGMLEGYNSEGMHQCITDGVAVCRRTGKLACVNCFREYALQVYTAADDLDMALHHARLIASNMGPYPDRGDRRHLGARNEGWLMLLRGQQDAAESSCERSFALCEGDRVSIPLSSRLHALIELETTRLLAGKQDPAVQSATLAAAGVKPEEGKELSTRLPEGERPDLELRWAFGDAVRACVQGDYAKALGILSAWDRKLTEQSALNDWFETRLRLIATQRLAGQQDKAEALARPLEARARKAHDWLTVRRLARLRDPGEKPTPLALLAPLTAGPFAGAARVAVEIAAPAGGLAERTANPQSAPETVPAAPETEEPLPLEEFFSGLVERMQAAEDDATRAGIRDDLLALPPASVTHPGDASRLLNLLRYLVADGERGEEIWRWAEGVAARFVQNAEVLSLLGVLGDTVHSADEDLAELVPKERIEKLLRQSLDLDTNDPGNHARAGAYFLGEENYGEAERCLARGFRLQRGNSFLALRLAEVYNQTERPRDALAVLDLCLREGCEDSQVAWEAALAAFRQEQYDVQLTYLDQFEKLTEADAWACYYRATALLELGRAEEVLPVLDEADRRDPDKPFPVEILRACATAALGRTERFREHTGLASLYGRLWKAAATLPEEDPLRRSLYRRLLQTGLAPEDVFDVVRQQAEQSANVNYYRCMARQPLDERWPESHGCLSGQDKWSGYRMVWGVLAHDEEAAGRYVLEWQGQCYPLPASIEECELEDDGYKDKCGVVWQGARWGIVAEEKDEEDDSE